ncbi:MAG: LicD family protein [Prevotella sp.]|nr:LicD family protein [Prevotella sp.]
MKELTPQELTEWKRIITDVLREFHDICRRNGLTYYGIGGTAIGAVRHKGIIPWDDDIDVGMPRPDFDRFVEICRTTDLGDYELVSAETHPDYNLSFPKFCNRNTTLIERADTPCVIGLFIDIFPLDNTSDDKREAESLVRQFTKLRNRYEALCTHTSFSQHINLLKTPHEWGRFVVKTIGYFFRPYMKRHYINKMNAIMRKYPYDSTDHIINYGGAYGIRELFSKDILDGKPASMPFEDITIDLMPDYDKYLRGIYGDYMKMPPEEKRIAHHLKAFYDLHKRVDNPLVS